MAVYQQNSAEIQAKLQDVIGQKAWNVQRNTELFMTMEFGPSLPLKEPNGEVRGEWRLLIYSGEWRLENEEHVIVASGDEGAKIDTAIHCLEGLALQSFEVMTPALDALLTFEHNLVLRIFSCFSEESEERGKDTWMLFTPDEGNVIVVHDGGQWSYSQAIAW